jgi:hypothetical protein
MGSALIEFLAALVEAALPPANAKLRWILSLIGLMVLVALLYLAIA